MCAELLAEKTFLRLHLRLSLRVRSVLTSSTHTAKRRDKEDFFAITFLTSPCCAVYSTLRFAKWAVGRMEKGS